MRTACILHAFLLVTLASGCKFFRRDSGRVLVRSKSDELLAQHADGKSDTLFIGARDAIPYPNGAGVLVVDKTNTFSRVETGRSGVVSCAAPPNVTLFAIDDSGNHVLFRTENKAAKTETVHFMELATCTETKLDVRYAYRGDVAPDGTEAAVGAFPTTCTGALAACAVTLYRLRGASSPVPMETLRASSRANYQPRYFPDGKLVFQTTERDATCDGTIDHCRHDIVSVQIVDGPNAPLALIREGALAAGISSDGKRMAYLSYWDVTGCHKALPCKTMTLKVGDWRSRDDSKDVSIAAGTVSNIPGHPFSVDNRFVAFATGNDYEPETCRIDGSDCKRYADHLVGWMK